MPSIKRSIAGDDRDLTPSANKFARTDSADFSGAVKKRLSGASRTGQACDRCKVRKIRCDARTGGCSPCLQNNTECKTTDRITGRATSRGHTESIEAENNALKAHLAELRSQLQEHGIEARPLPMLSNPYGAGHEAQSSSSWSPELYDLSGLLTQDTPPRGGRGSSTLPAFRADTVGDNYLGVSSANEWLSPIKGTSLALFGMELDLKNYVPDDEDEASALTSYAAYQELAHDTTPIERPPLPPYQQCRAFCDWFFKFVNSWLPIVHRPTFMDMIERIHREPQPQLNVPEKVQLHMVLAIILYQYAKRNPTQDQEAWKSHYRYSMTFFQELVAIKTLPSMQAMALVVSLLRGFPRPGAAWMLSSHALSISVEMGLHRSVTAWKDAGSRIDAHEIEMRKRVFWSLLACHVTVGSKLGRPLSIRVEDMDVEIPKPLNDNLPEEEIESDWRKCSFRAGVVGLKSIAIMMQIQSSIYAVRSTPQSYEPALKHLEKEVDLWITSIPVDLVGNNQDSVEDRVFALYLDFVAKHMSLLIHHPALCRTGNQDLMSSNLDKCLEASARLLQIASDMRDLKSIDSTWLSNTVFIAATFTTLFIYSERKDNITSTDLNNLKANMESWLDIMGDIGNLMGTGPRLQSALAQIINSAIGNISKHLAAKTASAAVATVSISRSPTGPSGPESTSGSSTHQNAPNYNSAYAGQQTGAGSDSQAGASYMTPNNRALGNQQNAYSSATPFAYPDPGNATITTYPSGSITFDGQDYNADIKPDISAQLAAHNAGLGVPQHHSTARSPLSHTEQAANALFQAYGSPQAVTGYTNAPVNDSPAGPLATPQTSGSVAWRQFADNMMNNASPHWSANALMALGQKSHPTGTGIVSAEGMGIELDPNAHWPMMTYQPQQHGGGAQ